MGKLRLFVKNFTFYTIVFTFHRDHKQRVTHILFINMWGTHRPFLAKKIIVVKKIFEKKYLIDAELKGEQLIYNALLSKRNSLGTTSVEHVTSGTIRRWQQCTASTPHRTVQPPHASQPPSPKRDVTWRTAQKNLLPLSHNTQLTSFVGVISSQWLNKFIESSCEPH